jgi:hypothetical protein
MLEEATESPNPRVKLLALRILERQSLTIRDLEFDHCGESPAQPCRKPNSSGAVSSGTAEKG